MKGERHILVIDDDLQVLDMLRCTLEEEGYSVDVAADGRSGLKLLKQHKPDLVLLDIKMPDLNGYEVLLIIREITEVPVLMITGLLEPLLVRRSINLGAGDYVRKPFDIPILLARIKSKLRRARGLSSVK
jgi:DNA-binding response OmpR family regulator